MTKIEKLTKEYLAKHTGLHEVSVEMDTLLQVVGAAFEDGYSAAISDAAERIEVMANMDRGLGGGSENSRQLKFLCARMIRAIPTQTQT